MLYLINEFHNFAQKHKGTFKVTHSDGFLFASSDWYKARLSFPNIKSNIEFTANETSYLKIKYDFTIDFHYKMLIYREDYLNKLGKFFRHKDIEINDIPFDTYFLSKPLIPNLSIIFNRTY